jgi:tetratricopeptide (TPR) repeat protein
MRWVRAAAAVAATLFICAQAPAPENPVIAHYRAYRAALEAGDLATAETSADAALQASVARSGQGGRTGVLALNLAQVRLQRGRVAEAYAPALQAFEASRTAESGVDPLLARLTLGRAELTDDRYRQARERLMPALTEAASRPDLFPDAYNAAADLGRKLMRENDYAQGAAAWREALNFADRIEGESTYVRAEARLGYGIAQLSNATWRYRMQGERQFDSTLQMNIQREFGPARRALIEAANITRPLAYQQGETLDLTPAQSLFGTAVAWRMMLDTYLLSTDLRGDLNSLRGDQARADAEEDISPPASSGGPFCNVELVTEPRPDFPAQAQSFFSGGAVVTRVTIDASGQVTDTRVAAAVPDRWFADAVARVAPQWTLRRDPASAANCRMPPILFQSWMFYYHS